MSDKIEFSASFTDQNVDAEFKIVVKKVVLQALVDESKNQGNQLSAEGLAEVFIIKAINDFGFKKNITDEINYMIRRGQIRLVTSGCAGESSFISVARVY